MSAFPPLLGAKRTSPAIANRSRFYEYTFHQAAYSCRATGGSARKMTCGSAWWSKDMIAVQGHRRSHLRAASAARMIQAFDRFYSAFTFVRFSDFVKSECNQRALQPAMIQNDSGPPQGLQVASGAP
jgi:hypothetical protein